jgi:hypothetical protein
VSSVSYLGRSSRVGAGAAEDDGEVLREDAAGGPPDRRAQLRRHELGGRRAARLSASFAHLPPWLLAFRCGGRRKW